MIKGSLFTREFLAEGIQQHPEWHNLLPDVISRFRANLEAAFQQFPVTGNPSESQTECDLIEPVLKALGFEHFIPQVTAAKKGRTDVPDYLLFENADQKAKGNSEKEQAEKYKYGLAILEAKAWQIPLDRRAGDAASVPSNQILRYLGTVETLSNRAIRWGILTNGRVWRLYFQGAKSRSEDFLELDLPLLLGLSGFQQELLTAGEQAQDWIKVFYLLFRREAFIRTAHDETSFHDRALAEGRHWEAQVAKDLSDVVFNEVFPDLARGLWKHDPQAPAALDVAYLSQLREAALTLLYRLLFVFYAEDRNLLPVKHQQYRSYALQAMRHEVERRLDAKEALSDAQDIYYRRLNSLFKAIDKGDGNIGLPPYNGGLFDRAAHALLNRAELPDAVCAPLIDKLSRRAEGGRRKWINYRDLSVQQLGSIYERLLEFELIAREGSLEVEPNIFARKTSGSYYTPEPLVRLVLEKSVGLLLKEKLTAFKAKCEELGAKRTAKAERIADLKLVDPATQMLELRICDPAMGSGHFLVSLVDYLADHVLMAMEEAGKQVSWADESAPYVSPLSDRIHTIRAHIKDQAATHRWQVEEDQLDDKHIVRRMILKRCIYGVDKNPMAVELAKVSLWLHTFTVGAPLSFLDHHLRSGNSLFGEFVHGVDEYIRKHGTPLFIGTEIAKARQTAKGMAMIEQITDADISEVRESASKFHDIAEATRPISQFFSMIHATRWQDPKDKEAASFFAQWLDGQLGDQIKLAAGAALPAKAPAKVKEWVARLQELGREENFLHWEIAFPGVWDKWESPRPPGGFDAVIGNPPWDRIKLQEVEWFAARRREISLMQKASDRKKAIAALEKKRDPLWKDYVKAEAHAQASARVARMKGDYPLLSGGDINIYSLFVERAHRLVKRDGLVGLVVPSGIASDLGASEFFKSIATASRLAGFYDFENKKIFFPDVDSRFKFSVYIAGAQKRTFEQAELAFFLHEVATLADPNRCFTLSAEDFARVNPNTGTAPIFRTRRDAEITRRIYENFPVLVHHEVGAVWPVKYCTMFHMTNDSHLFHTRAELEKNGCYPVEGNRWKKGKEEFLPLYEGKMVQAYDHRAASVVVNKANLNRPAQPEEATEEQHKDPEWLPAPQFWVHTSNLSVGSSYSWFIAYKSITAPTNVRTMIASFLPRVCVGNSMGLLPFKDEDESKYPIAAPLILANLNTLILDYVLRQKVQGQNLNWYIVEQLPVIPPEAFEKKIGRMKVGDFIRREVLHLTYTAYDMQPFARDMGYEGEPFTWDEEDRRHRKARLDAMFFLLYSLSRDDAAYILSTFPIVERDDMQQYGHFLTRDLILAYMNALKAEDTETRVKVSLPLSGLR